MLLERYVALEEQNADLQLRLEDLREDAIRDKKEIADLRDRVRKLEIARALSETDESRQHAKQQITSIINRIDRAMEALK